MPDFDVDALPYNDQGYVSISFPGSSQQSVNWYAWRVYRRDVGGDWQLLQQYSTSQANYTFRDYLARANQPQEWAVVEATSSDGGQTISEGSYQPKQRTPSGLNYWLIHPHDENLSMMLRAVNKDSFEQEEEEEELLLLGRGRKVDRGRSWGISGSLDCKFRDAPGWTGREQRQQFAILRSEPTHLFLRNPFGDVLKIALFGGTSYEREAGIGVREFVEVGVEYREVV